MRSHRFINSLLYLVIQLEAKESKAKEDNAWIRCFFVLFLDKRYISQVIHFKNIIRDQSSFGLDIFIPLYTAMGVT